MTFVNADRVQETFTTTGTGTISLGGAVTGYQAFSAALADTNTCYYAMSDGTNWEVGIGTYATSGNTLARTTLLASSSGAKISWAAGTKNVWLDLPAAALPTAAGVTGSGQMVLATSPTLVTPALGTPASGNLTNCTNAPVGRMTALGVGSIILASTTTTTAAGATVAASALTSYGFHTSNNPPSYATTGDTLAGTWQALQSASSTTSANNMVLWQRTA